jgi:hypothetical protein
VGVVASTASETATGDTSVTPIHSAALTARLLPPPAVD